MKLLQIRSRAAIAALFFALIASSCGGGGGGGASAPVSAAPQALRTDIHVGYYLGSITSVLQTADHTDLHWASGIRGGNVAWWTAMADELNAVRGRGDRMVVLHLPQCHAKSAARRSDIEFQLRQLAATGLLKGFDEVWLYWCDEPEQGPGSDPTDDRPYTDAEALAANAWIHGLAASIPDLKSSGRTAVIWNCRSDFPGFAGTDRPACDDYERGCNVLAVYDQWLERIAAANSTQRPFLVPGGASVPGGQQNPSCYEAYAQAHPPIVAIVTFTFEDWIVPGVDVNGTLQKWYCPMGRRLTRKGDPARC